MCADPNHIPCTLVALGSTGVLGFLIIRLRSLFSRRRRTDAAERRQLIASCYRHLRRSPEE